MTTRTQERLSEIVLKIGLMTMTQDAERCVRQILDSERAISDHLTSGNFTAIVDDAVNVVAFWQRLDGVMSSIAGLLFALGVK